MVLIWGVPAAGIALSVGIAYLFRTPVAPEIQLTPLNLEVLAIDLVGGPRMMWDDDPWEGAIAITDEPSGVVQMLSWHHGEPLTKERAPALLSSTMTYLQALGEVSEPQVSEISAATLKGAHADGFSWTVASSELTTPVFARVTAWTCPATSLNATLTTASMGKTDAKTASRTHDLSEQSVLCLPGAATTEPRANIQFLGGREWARQPVASGGSEQWVAERSGSFVVLYTRRSAKVDGMLRGGSTCKGLLEIAANDGLARYGARRSEGDAFTPTITELGCTLVLPATVDVDGGVLPIRVFWELRACGDGTHLFAGFVSADRNAYPNPSTLWACGAKADGAGAP